MIVLFLGVITLGVCAKAVLDNLEYEDLESVFGESGSVVEIDEEYLEYYGLGVFETDLPVVYIDTDGESIVKESKIWAEISVLNADEDGEMQSILSIPDYTSAITINLRGASSYLVFDKEQYRIKFYQEEGEFGALDVSFLGMDADSEWILHGPFLDRSLQRNSLIYGISEEILEWAPDTQFCEVFVNGEYKGMYLAVEAVTEGIARLDLEEFGLLSGETAYIIKRDRSDTEENSLDTYGKLAGYTWNDLYLSYPSSYDVTDAQMEWVINDINEFEEVLYSDDFADEVNGYAKYIDVDNFVDYLIINEATMNNDAGNLSTYAYKKLGEKLKMTVWDFNNAYDNYQWFGQDYDEFFMEDNSWFDRLLQDRAFVDKVVERYAELRQTTLSTEYLYSILDEGEAELGDSIERNFAIWGYTFSDELLIREGDDDNEPENYEEAMEQLKVAIDTRLTFLDEHITDLYDGCIN